MLSTMSASSSWFFRARVIGVLGLLVLAAAGGCGGDGDEGSGVGPGGETDGGGSSGGPGGGGADGGGSTPGVTAYDVFTAPGTNKSTDEALGIARAADGKLVVGGTCGAPASEENPFTNVTASCVVRLGANGQLDTTFGTAGRVVLPAGWIARKVGVQTDGKIVIVGAGGLGRLLADGKIDTTFGKAGLVEEAGAANLAFQSDGKIVVTGAKNGLARTARYLADGSPDATFGTAGAVESDVTPQNDFGVAVAIQADGKIVVAGVGANGPGQRRFIVLRYLADGKPDTAFDTDGRVTSAFKGDDLARDVAIDDAQNIVVVGSGSPADSIVARYTPAGALDTTFNGTGYRLVANDSSCDAVATQAGGTITCGGYGLLRRYTTTGAPDGTFGSSGKVAAQIRGEDMVLLEDGSVVLVGQRSGVTEDLSAVKYSNAGELDTTFGTNGFADVDSGAAFDVASAVLGAEDGSAILAGESALGGQFVKLGPTGALDPTFGTGGIAAPPYVWAVRGIAKQASGKLVFAAWGQNVTFVVGRLEANGTLDKTFGGIGGGLVTVPKFGSATGKGIVTDGSSIWAVGGSVLVKLEVDGKIDTTFGKQGLVDPAVNAPGGITRQPDGKLVVWSTAAAGKVVRFDPTSGAVDATFGSATGLAGPDGFSPTHVAAQPDGKLLLTWVDAARTTLRLERRGGDGVLDASFGQGGVVTETLAPITPKVGERASAVALDDGRIALVTSESDDIVVFLYDGSGVRATSFGQGGRLSLRKSGARLAARAKATAVGKTLFAAGTALVGADGDFALGRLPL